MFIKLSFMKLFFYFLHYVSILIYIYICFEFFFCRISELYKIILDLKASLLSFYGWKIEQIYSCLFIVVKF